MWCFIVAYHGSCTICDDLKNVGTVISYTTTSHHTGEVVPWINGILSNKCDNATHYVLLHDHRESWHRGRISHRVKPEKFRMLASRRQGPWIEKEGELIHNGISEVGNIVRLAQCLLSLDPTTYRKRYGSQTCCAEAVVNVQCIKRVPRYIWTSIRLAVMREEKSPWGWILERLWPAIWENSCFGGKWPSEQTVKQCMWQ